MNELDPLRVPVAGRLLIEASAGTGKTHAIGSLLLRVLLGLAGEDAEPSPVRRLDEVLIVTFTNAATAELRDRIRQRLAAAREAFAQGSEYGRRDDADPLLVALIEAAPDPLRAQVLLGAAMGQLDEAAIYTIHAFCQRMLTERAFESGAVFDTDFVLDDSDYRSLAVRDHWRRLVYPLDPDLAAVITSVFRDPDALLKSVAPHLGRPDLRLDGVPDESVEALATRARSLAEDAKRAWKRDEVRADLEASRVRGAKGDAGAAAMLDAVDAWAATDEFLLAVQAADGGRESVARCLRPYTREALTDPAKLKLKGVDPVIGDFAERVSELVATLDALLIAVRADAISAIRDGLEAAKRADRMIAPDDVLRQTARSLEGERGLRFAEAVRLMHPVAFIDEFQDTDPLQFRIFDALYPADDPAGTALVMIGDPKQAIYGFRGADVFAYLQARQALPGEAWLEMDTNWRSTPEMLAALEALYGAASDPFASPDIRFIPVRPRPGAERGSFTRGDAPSPALTFWHWQTEATRGVSTMGVACRALARIAAGEIAAMMGQGFCIDGRPLAQGDITVLVFSHHDAELMRTELAEQGIASVRQGRSSVFATDTAMDLAQVLAAVVEPRDERAVRAALATRLFDLSLGRLHAETLGDELRWQQHLDAFQLWHELMRDAGPMVMIDRLLADHGIPARLLATPDGPRRLTDLRHLGELLQMEAARLGSMQRVLRWFVDQVAEPLQSDAAQIRLESDADLVRIVTIHAAKGLEYEVVVLPFGVGQRTPRDQLHHLLEDGRWQAVLDLAAGGEVQARAAQEQLAEETRLLYVALTRARRACFVGIANTTSTRKLTSDLHRGALGRLLASEPQLPISGSWDDAGISARLQALAQHCDDIVVRSDFSIEATAPVALTPAALARPRQFTGRIERDWRVTSYSALIANTAGDGHGHGHGHDAVALQPGGGDETDLGFIALPDQADADDGAAGVEIAARFPRGARPGSCLHDVLEHWPVHAPDAADHVRRTLASWGFGGGEQADAAVAPDAVTAWMQRVRSTPLGIGASLAELAGRGSGADRRQVAEMEFHLPIHGLDTARLCRLLGAHGYNDGPLALHRVLGMLRGFIDLVFEDQGRYWVVDYKSNWLGASVAAYSPPVLADAIRAHRYDLQFLIYSVALRRLLRARLGEGGEARFGGVLYLFLRGMDGSGATGIHREVPDSGLLAELDALFAGAGT